MSCFKNRQLFARKFKRGGEDVDAFIDELCEILTPGEDEMKEPLRDFIDTQED